jgi:hypothetical protein
VSIHVLATWRVRVKKVETWSRTCAYESGGVSM